jgi:hypothetical protein
MYASTYACTYIGTYYVRATDVKDHLTLLSLCRETLRTKTLNFN